MRYAALPPGPGTNDACTLFGEQRFWGTINASTLLGRRGYWIIKELVSFRQTDKVTGMNLRNPEIDFVSLCESMGLTPAASGDPQGVSVLCAKHSTAGKPSLVDIRVQRRCSIP